MSTFAPFCTLLLALPFLTGCATEILKGQVATAEKNETAARAELAESQKKQAAIGADNESLLRRLAAAEQERTKLTDQIAAMTEQVGVLTARFEERQRVLADENGRLAEEIRQSREKIAFQNASLARTPTEVIIPNRSEPALDFGDPAILPPRRDGDKIIVELQDRLLFEPGTVKLTDAGKARLVRVAKTLLTSRPDGRIRIDAHTIPGDGADAGHAAAFLKGKTVFEFFVAGRTIPPERLALAACGVSSPILTGTAPAALERNRRIELVFE